MAGTSPAMTTTAIQPWCIPHQRPIVVDMTPQSSFEAARFACRTSSRTNSFGGDDGSHPSHPSDRVSLIKRQQTQTVMVNPLLSVVVYFS
jgi:hypothetical protein